MGSLSHELDRSMSSRVGATLSSSTSWVVSLSQNAARGRVDLAGIERHWATSCRSSAPSTREPSAPMT
jgi:hypothetical protein